MLEVIKPFGRRKGNWVDPEDALKIAESMAPVKDERYDNYVCMKPGRVELFREDSDDKFITKIKEGCSSICSVGIALYISKDNAIGDAMSFMRVKERDSNICALYRFRNVMYDACADNKIYRTLDDGLVAERESKIWRLSARDGVLYDAGEYGVYDTLKNEQVADRVTGVSPLIADGKSYDDEVERTFRALRSIKEPPTETKVGTLSRTVCDVSPGFVEKILKNA